MKELSIEEKAKRYDEAIERAKHSDGIYPSAKELKEYIFPELRESEDERMKEAIIAIIHLYYGEPLEDEAKEMIAWLEKQGEQKTAEWSEEDDEIVSFLTKNFEECEKGNSICFNRFDSIKYGNWLKNLKDRVQLQPKQEWSEEDTNMFGSVLSTLGIYSHNPTIPADIREIHKKEERWFSDLYNRLCPQEWSEEDENTIKRIIHYLNFASKTSHTSTEIISECIDWLKSLRPQKQDVMSVDEFRRVVGYLVQDIVANEHMAETEKQPTKFFVDKYYDKLRSQSHWKPSKEQLEALMNQCINTKSTETGAFLCDLYYDLKKLMEE